MRLPTIAIADDNPRGYKIINKRDFDRRKHKPYTAPKAAVPKPAPEPVAPEAVDMADVEAMTWPQLRSYASEVSDAPISTKEDALEAIRAHRAAQGGAD